MKRGKKRQYLFYYLLFYIYFIITLPLLILVSLLLKFFSSIKWITLLFEWHEKKLNKWYEFIDLYKITGYKYRSEEYTNEIYTDKREKSLQEKERYIETDFVFFDDATIIYYEPFECPALKKYIQNHIKSINASLGVKNQKLFYWPLVCPNSKKIALQNIIYNNTCKKIQKSDELFSFFNDPKWISLLLNDWLETVKIDGPCFLQYSGIIPETNRVLYSVFHLPYKKKREIKNALNYYTYQLWDNGNRIFFQKTDRKIQNDTGEIF